MSTRFCDSRYDRRKVFFHTRALADILDTGDTWPVTVNTGFTTYCNHSCIWCSSAYTTRIVPTLKTRDELLIQPDVWIRNIRLLAARGTKGLIIAGQGEPLLHPEAASMLDAAAQAGLKYMLFSNGQRLNERFHESFFAAALAVRFSVDAASAAMHERWHAATSANGQGRADFDKVLRNISNLVAEKKRRQATLPHIGCQMICSSLTRPEFDAFARLFKDIGVDYVAFKSLQGNQSTRNLIATASNLHQSEEERAACARDMIQELHAIRDKYQAPGFDVFIKEEQIREAYVREYNGAEKYDRCRAHPLTPMIEPDGKVYICIDHGGDDTMVIGNIYDDDIETIWRSARRQQVIAAIDLQHKCPAGCFLDEANVILHELAHPDEGLHWQLI